MTKLLFVCLGNICRSPAAENIMNHLVAQAGMSDRIECDSAGTASYHTGNPPDRRMRAAAANRDLPMVGKARQFTKADFTAFDLILAMDRENYHNILALVGSAAPSENLQEQYRDKVKLMCDFATEHLDKEVPDPYYGGAEGFDYVIDLLLDACSGLLLELETTAAKKV
ncbi:low molecular weight protein-tyrosine-phosphatase [Chamaesiphon minutus]|uniref:protein-tyrosine-phosphatase n=1 Tax=Chamaesiphon minutus (strain ATCC 27169 / PCC 6605) TaxID=1173020 RepID=K9UH82_CHAP6|nr:low molecular weight protein-tyrosine-phosphatase [Chamaesiphon minutus]AFY94008.1 protein-tyrosine-phosphatase [Chamaesiphon minutus PCC 6605]